PVQVLVLQWDVLPLRDLEPADDFVLGHRLTAFLAHLLVADGRQVSPFEEVEAKLLRLGCAVHPHRDADQAEGDRAAPDRSHNPRVPHRGPTITRLLPTFGRGRRRGTSLWILWMQRNRPAGGTSRADGGGARLRGCPGD